MNEYSSVSGVTRNHDDNGNLIDNGTFLFVYDAKDRLVRVFKKASGNLVADYLYDCGNRRTKKIVYSQTNPGQVEKETNFFYDGWEVCEEQNSSGQTEITYVYGNGIDEILEFIRTADHPLGAGQFFCHQDIQKNVVAITDASGALVEKTFYDAYGAALDSNKQPISLSAVGSPYGFQGRRLDAETGLYYFRHRYYDPETGRFIQRDPVWDANNVGNQYSFANANIINGMDPFGLEGESLREKMLGYAKKGASLYKEYTFASVGFKLGFAAGVATKFGTTVVDTATQLYEKGRERPKYTLTTCDTVTGVNKKRIRTVARQMKQTNAGILAWLNFPKRLGQSMYRTLNALENNNFFGAGFAHVDSVEVIIDAIGLVFGFKKPMSLFRRGKSNLGRDSSSSRIRGTAQTGDGTPVPGSGIDRPITPEEVINVRAQPTHEVGISRPRDASGYGNLTHTTGLSDSVTCPKGNRTFIHTHPDASPPSQVDWKGAQTVALERLDKGRGLLGF